MDEGNLAATYSALAALIALEVDLAAEVDGNAVVLALGSLQQEDGRCGDGGEVAHERVTGVGNPRLETGWGCSCSPNLRRQSCLGI